MTDPIDNDLDAIFGAARGQSAMPSDDLMARVLADANALQPEAKGVPVAEPAKTSFWDLFGGWPALSGVAAAGVAGLWLGLAPTAAIETVTSDVFGTGTTVGLLSDVGGLVLEDVDG